MGKLFLMENSLKKVGSRIRMPRNGKVDSSVVKVVFEKREVPDEITREVYGVSLDNPFDTYRDIWGNPRTQLFRRAKYDALIKIGSISATMSMQEFANLVDILSTIMRNGDSTIAMLSENSQDVF